MASETMYDDNYSSWPGLLSSLIPDGILLMQCFLLDNYFFDLHVCMPHSCLLEN